MRSIVIHGHFYQPPRDDPWLGTIPREASAAPYHDWNERIERESYAPVAASLASLSFDFGPTLLAWMERHAAATYGAVLAADRAGVAAHAGHGNAIAMPYHHTILPLSSRRDKETEVRWGIADFRRRFGREPEGMWLPETAVDDETLDVLAAEGIRFTILAPHQVERVPAGGRPGGHRTAAVGCTGIARRISAGAPRCGTRSTGWRPSCTGYSSGRGAPSSPQTHGRFATSTAQSWERRTTRSRASSASGCVAPTIGARSRGQVSCSSSSATRCACSPRVAGSSMTSRR